MVEAPGLSSGHAHKVANITIIVRLQREAVNPSSDRISDGPSARDHYVPERCKSLTILAGAAHVERGCEPGSLEPAALCARLHLLTAVAAFVDTYSHAATLAGWDRTAPERPVLAIRR
jgi:hypothetical protein